MRSACWLCSCVDYETMTSTSEELLLRPSELHGVRGSFVSEESLNGIEGLWSSGAEHGTAQLRASAGLEWKRGPTLALSALPIQFFWDFLCTSASEPKRTHPDTSDCQT